MQPQILLADDHSMIRKGLMRLLQLHLGITDIQEAPSRRELMNELLKKKYTHLVLELAFSDGSTLEVLPHIRNLYPDMRVMVFSMQPVEEYGADLKQCGIQYYLSKTTPEEDTIRLLRQFVNNEHPVREGAGIPHPNNPFSSLAPRELEILHFVLKGMGTKEIAQSLHVKMNTISTVKNRIFEKTATADLKELLELASLYNVYY